MDPYLQKRLDEMGMGREDILSYISRSERIDICFEDSWTGYFIAERFEKRRRGDNLTIIHLDDHTDMMATLLHSFGRWANGSNERRRVRSQVHEGLEIGDLYRRNQYRKLHDAALLFR